LLLVELIFTYMQALTMSSKKTNTLLLYIIRRCKSSSCLRFQFCTQYNLGHQTISELKNWLNPY